LVNFWSKYPIVRLFVPYVFGVSFAAINTMEDPFWVCVLLILCFVTYLAFIAFSAFKKELQSIVLFALFTLLGAFSVAINWDYKQANYATNLNADYFIVELESTPDYRSGFYCFKATIEKAYVENRIVEAAGKVQLKIEHDHESKELRKGDFVLVNDDLAFAVEDSIPFNKYGNVFLKGSFSPFEWAPYKDGKRWWIDSWYGKVVSILKEKFESREALGVAKALILGNKSDIDYTTYRIFADAGAMHILAVSGLHVGIVAGLLSVLFAWLPFLRRYKLLKAGFIIMALVIYAALTGFSPSVCRAVLMFSLFILGYNFKRDVDIYNIIAASAFILLIINPLWLFSVGFQLSYMAVLGIVYWYRKIRPLVKLNNRVFQWLWDVTVVSITAQIGTFPLSLYYFEQFPVLGIVANPVAIVCALLVVSLGLLLIILSPFGFINLLDFVLGALAGLIEWVILTASQFFAWIQSMPFSVFKIESFNIAWVFSFYLAMLLLVIWLQTIKSKKLYGLT